MKRRLKSLNIWYNFKWNQPYLNRGLNLNRRSNSLNSATDYIIYIFITIILFLHGYKFNSFLLFNQMKTYIISFVFVKFWILSLFIQLLNFSMFTWIWGRRIILPKKVNPIIVPISKYFSIYTRPKNFKISKSCKFYIKATKLYIYTTLWNFLLKKINND